MYIILILIINAAALYLMFHYFRWKVTSADFLKDINRRKDEISGEISAIIIELNRTTERNLQIIESRINQLKELNQQSEQISEVLKKNKNDLYGFFQRAEKKEIRSEAEEKEKEKEKSAKKEIKITSQDSSSDTYHNYPSEIQKQNNLTDNELLKDKVLRMYNNGIEAGLIARNLGITSGEVDLIISLNNAGSR